VNVFSRIHLDADVRMTGSSASAVLKRLSGACAQAPGYPLVYGSTGVGSPQLPPLAAGCQPS
jgi:hypothetical protein